jgi:pimeloyl-ACP methyl ester carboxylesterase
MRGVELVNVEIYGELHNVVLNGVDVAPLVDADLNRRQPERAKMRPDDADGFREAWAILVRRWDGPLTLPGQGDAAASATLDDQLAAVLAAVDVASDKPMVVGHSAACTLAWLAAEARPEMVAKVALIGGFPSPDGATYADFFESKDGVMAFPGWAQFEGPDSADLDDEARSNLAAAAIPVPEGVTKGVVRLADERRFDVPVVLVCPEFSPAQAQEWIAAGEVPELAKTKHLEFVDLDSGHWPMISQPVQLAQLIAAAAEF